MPAIVRSEFALALHQVATERGIDVTVVLDTIKAAIVAAYRKDYGADEIELVTVEPFDVLLGDAFGSRLFLRQCGVIYYKFNTAKTSGAIGVLGPSRLNYPYLMPVVRYMGSLIGELGSRW